MHLQLGILAAYELEYAKVIFLVKQAVVSKVRHTQVLVQAQNGTLFSPPYQMPIDPKKGEGPSCGNFAISSSVD